MTLYTQRKRFKPLEQQERVERADDRAGIAQQCQPQFGDERRAAELCGVDLEEYTFTDTTDQESHIIWDGEKVDAPVFNDVLAPLCDDVEVLGTFGKHFYQGKPGLTVKKLGKGRVYYFGGAFSEQTAEVFLRKLNVKSPFERIIDAPEEVELSIREKDGKQYVFALNYTREEQKITLKQETDDLFSGEKASREQVLEPFGVRVYLINNR